MYILVLIKPNKMNQIANYFSEDLRLKREEVIYIGLIAIPIILILFSMVPAIKLLQLGELKSQSLVLTSNKSCFDTHTSIYNNSSRDSIYRYYWFHRHDSASTDKTLLWRFTLGIQMILNILIGATMMLIADWIGVY